MLRKMTAEENVKFNIGWNSFQSHLEETSKELYTGGHFADCTLVSDDMIPTQAHKIVLSSASIVFKQLLMLNPNSNTNPVLFLKGVKHEELKSILQFIYCGETNVHKDRFDKFILATNDLDIKGLSRSFDNYWPMNPGGWSGLTRPAPARAPQRCTWRTLAQGSAPARSAEQPRRSAGTSTLHTTQPQPHTGTTLTLTTFTTFSLSLGAVHGGSTVDGSAPCWGRWTDPFPEYGQYGICSQLLERET